MNVDQIPPLALPAKPRWVKFIFDPDGCRLYNKAIASGWTLDFKNSNGLLVPHYWRKENSKEPAYHAGPKVGDDVWMDPFKKRIAKLLRDDE